MVLFYFIFFPSLLRLMILACLLTLYIKLILRQSYYIRDFCLHFPKLKMLNNSGVTRVRREQ